MLMDASIRGSESGNDLNKGTSLSRIGTGTAHGPAPVAAVQYTLAVGGWMLRSLCSLAGLKPGAYI